MAVSAQVGPVLHEFRSFGQQETFFVREAMSKKEYLIRYRLVVKSHWTMGRGSRLRARNEAFICRSIMYAVACQMYRLCSNHYVIDTLQKQRIKISNENAG